MKKSVKILCSVLAAIFLVVLLFCTVLFSQMQPVNKRSSEKVKFEVPYGKSVYSISYELKSRNLIKNSKLFYYYARFTKAELKSGTYYLSSSMNYDQIVKELSSGQAEFVKVSIPEGLTVTKIGTILEENRVCTVVDFKESCRKLELINKYLIPSETFEGYLFPDTYFLNIGMDSDSVVTLMVDNFFEKIKTVDGLSEKSIEDLNEIVKLASVVEREYRVPEEAPLIASVFRNRLKYNIGLYSCATVEYIITEIEGRPHPDRILLSDTRIESPYNTYLHAGLPPSPISNPGLVALDAAANTPKTKYYYFQIVDSEKGKHVFSETFEEHKVNHNLSLKK